MTRLSRIVLPGWVHHVTQRGNHRQRVFFADTDQSMFMRLLDKYFLLNGIALIGHCLMSNHAHLAVIPKTEQSLGDGIGRLHHDFARFQNLQCGRTGHLWQERFFSCPVEEERVWEVLSYIELNPVRAGLVANAWDWEWSSAGAHVTGVDPHGSLDMELWRKYFDGEGWRKYLEQMARDQRAYDQIRKATATGRLFGNTATAERLEKELGRRILPAKRGRKCKPSAGEIKW